jgi:hypothetical protein
MGDDLRKFFQNYDVAFTKGPSNIAEFYYEPCITARMAAARLNITRKDTEAFFGPVLEKYRAQGFTRADIVSLESQPLGINSVLATIRWAYKDMSNNTLWEWTFSYNLYKSNGAWKILLQTMHDS